MRKDNNLILKWNQALNIDCSVKGVKLCKKHFAPNYILKLQTGRHRLHPKAFPIPITPSGHSSKLVPKKVSIVVAEMVGDEMDGEMTMEVLDEDEIGEIPEEAEVAEEIGSQCHHVTGDDHENGPLHDHDKDSIYENEEFEDNRELREDFSDGTSVKCDSDASVHIVCGLPSLDHLTYLCKKYESLKSNVKDIKARIIMTMMMLKNNLSYEFLGILFRCSAGKVSYTVKETLAVLSEILSPAIFWQEKGNVRLPICFQKFKNIRAIVQCLEVSVEKPSCINCRKRLFSTKKSSHTVKFVIAVAPCGTTAFISDSYGGATESTDIIDSSGFVNKFEEGDAIMADEGLLIGLIGNV